MAPTKAKHFSAVKPPRTAKQHSTLMNLPPEIRNRIYELTFEDTNNQIATWRPAVYNRPDAPGLLLTCRQTHSEALRIYYSTATFTFTDWYSCGIWSRGVGSVRERWLRYVRIDGPWLRVKEGGTWYDRKLSDMTLREVGEAAVCALDRLEESTFVERKYAEVLVRTEDKRLGWSKNPRKDVELFIEYHKQREAGEKITASAEGLRWLEKWYARGPFRL